MKVDEFLERAWKGYAAITPDAGRVHELLRARGERIVNDHVAFRTFDLPGITRLDVGGVFEEWGYRRQEGDLDFPAKKLKASYWQHERSDLPKIFVSELLLGKVGDDLKQWIGRVTEKALSRAGRLTPELLLAPSWDPVAFGDYERFYPLSEYAAWTAAFGIRVNHFTVLVNELKTLPNLGALNRFLTDSGFKLNEAGGTIKGTRAQGLEQSSTQARKIPWTFAGGTSREIMSCYYEFALRHPLPGETGLFQGFVPESADKIFESNFERKDRQ